MNTATKIEIIITSLRDREGYTGLSMEEVTGHIRLSDILALDVPKTEAAAVRAIGELIRKAEADAKRIREHNRLQAEVAQIANA